MRKFQTMAHIGIDIAQDTFEAAFHIASSSSDPEKPKFQEAGYDNTVEGHQKFLQRLTPGEDHVIMEATGPYGYRLALTLYEAGITVSVVNPLQIKRFAQMKLRRAKTDRADARLICLYGMMNHPAPYTPPEPYLVLLKQLAVLEEKLLQIRLTLGNQLHAFSRIGTQIDPVAEESLADIQALLQEKITSIRRRIDTLLLEHNREQYQALQTIPAIGKKAAALLLILTGNFRSFPSAKHVAAYCGICPQLWQSGTCLPERGQISKRGSALLRRILYLCAVSAIRWNRACQEFYRRLVAKGKPKKVALIATANKLLRHCFAVAKSGKPFQDIIAADACF